MPLIRVLAKAICYERFSLQQLCLEVDKADLSKRRQVARRLIRASTVKSLGDRFAGALYCYSIACLKGWQPARTATSDDLGPERFGRVSDTDAKSTATRELIFPPWVDTAHMVLAGFGGFAALYIVCMFNFGASPKTMAVGYMPEQPVPYSHKLHVGELGMDCRYCHTGVEVSAKAGIPPTQTCMNCHAKVHVDSPKLEPVRQSFATGQPVEWIRIHDLPDYTYFNHSAHVTRGVGCASCHGRIDKMEEVWQDQPISMGWCLDCHRNPFPHIRPLDKVTDMTYEPDEATGRQLLAERGWDTEENINRKIRQLTSCSTCHR